MRASLSDKRTVVTAFAFLALCATFSVPARAQICLGSVQYDRPTLSSLGVKLPFSGDLGEESTVTVQYAPAGTGAWTPAQPLWRVHPEDVTEETVAASYGGSILGLTPNTTYDVELTIADAGGIYDASCTTPLAPIGQPYVLRLAGASANGGLTTRAVPADPVSPAIVRVSTVTQLTKALKAAKAGQIISLAAGTYRGHFQITASGTAANPIVIRGANTLDACGVYDNATSACTYHDNTVLDGQNCPGCNVIEVYGSNVHVEWLTIQNGNRALRSLNATTGNVYRRLHTRNTGDGITGAGSGGAQTDFYIADNILEGRLRATSSCSFSDCSGSDIDGIAVWGHGHVVAHNRVSGFGDAIANSMVGARALDIYGNDVLFNYDDGTELDHAEGNLRFFRNRVSNSWEGVSFQPVNGGPAYVFRNVVINIRNEQMKIHPHGTQPTSGFLAYNNTFASASTNSYGGHSAWNNQTSGPCYHFAVQNNLFQGPNPGDGANEVDVTCHQTYGTGGTIDHNGYDRDFGFAFYLDGYVSTNGTYTAACTLPPTYANQEFCQLSDVQAFTPFESHGQIVSTNGWCTNGSMFNSCWLPPLNNTTYVTPPPDLTPAHGSTAIGAALLLANVNDTDSGSVGGTASPSLGALEPGCVAAMYGPRPVGLDERYPYSCGGYSGYSGTQPGTVNTVAGNWRVVGSRWTRSRKPPLFGFDRPAPDARTSGFRTSGFRTSDFRTSDFRTGLYSPFR